MANYESRYANLGFYVDGGRRRFLDGKYVTDVAKEIAVLDAIPEATRVDDKKSEEKAGVSKDDVKTDAPKAPANKPPAKAQSGGSKRK